MALFAVSYQLNKAKNYQPLWDEMENLGAQKAMKDFFLLDRTNDTAASVRDHLKQFIDSVDDMIIVVKMGGRPAPWRCYQGTSDWINARF